LGAFYYLLVGGISLCIRAEALLVTCISFS
jgi:hypothetical protein